MAYALAAGFHFRVEFGTPPLDVDDTRFQEVVGLGAEVTTEEVVEGGENRFSHRLPVRAKYANLVLKRGLLNQSSLIAWIKHSIEHIEADGEHRPKTVNVTLLDEKQEPLADTYSFVNCWPVKWALSDLKAQDNAIAVETLELSYNYFSRIRL